MAALATRSGLRLLPWLAPPAADGTSFMKSAIAYQCQPLTGGREFIGSDLVNSPCATPDMCCGHCRARNGCTGFSWSNYNCGTCWLKSGVLTAIPKNGVTSARVAAEK